MTFVIWSANRWTTIFDSSLASKTSWAEHNTYRKKDRIMSLKAGNWIIGIGAAGMLVGLCFVPAVAMDHSDTSLLALGACAFSLGSLMVAGGMYVKTRMLQAGLVPAPQPASPKKAKGGCDLCRGDMPIIQCRVHQLHMCAACMAEHYDNRSCAYTPSTRRPATKSMARAHGA